MSARVTFLVAVLMLGGGGVAHAACGSAIGEFEAIINSDLETGNVAKRVHARVMTELGPVKSACSAGRDAEATRALAAVKSRHGYR
jgi:carbamate kinase